MTLYGFSVVASDFVGWAGLGPVAMLIENIIGIRVNTPAEEVVWNLTRTDTHGIDDLWMGDFGSLDLESAARTTADSTAQLSVDWKPTDGRSSLTLRVIRHGSLETCERVFSLSPGTSNLTVACSSSAPRSGPGPRPGGPSSRPGGPGPGGPGPGDGEGEKLKPLKPPFQDMDQADESHRADITRIFRLGVTAGTSAMTYSPSDVVTRQQMASFMARLYRALTGSEAPVVDVPFEDLDQAGGSHRADIARIFGLGVTVGTSAVTSSPSDVVTREQMASFMARLYRAVTGSEAPVVDVPFEDLDQAGESHRADIARIFGLGVTVGTSATTYSPRDVVTREQMASFIARLYLAIVGSEAPVPGAPASS